MTSATGIIGAKEIAQVPMATVRTLAEVAEEVGAHCRYARMHDSCTVP
jgi:hypothetical protein